MRLINALYHDTDARNPATTPPNICNAFMRTMDRVISALQLRILTIHARNSASCVSDNFCFGPRLCAVDADAAAVAGVDEDDVEDSVLDRSRMW